MNTPAPTFLGRLWRWTKCLARVTTVFVIGTVAVAGFGVPAASRTAWARGRMEKTLTRSLGTPVQIGAMEWSWKKGLRLQEVLTSATGEQTTFRIDRIQLHPRLVKLMEGQLRFRATLENPEISVTGSGPSLRVPKFPKKGVRIDQLDLVNATIIVTDGDDSVAVERLTVRGSGRVEGRILRLDLSSIEGTCEDAPFTGQGTLRLSREGFSGRIGMNEAAAKDSAGLQKVLRALHLSPAAPVLSEPF